MIVGNINIYILYIFLTSFKSRVWINSAEGLTTPACPSLTLKLYVREEGFNVYLLLTKFGLPGVTLCG